VNQFVLSRTTTDVPTGTRTSCYQGPKSDETPWHSTTCRSRNFTNLESFGFLLTRSRVFQPVAKRAFVNSRQRARTRHRFSKDGSRVRNWTAAELGADRVSRGFSVPKRLLRPAEQGARSTLFMLRFSRAKLSSVASGLRDHSKIASFGRGTCVVVRHSGLSAIEILHDGGGVA
jgi:hypothetical protein